MSIFVIANRWSYSDRRSSASQHSPRRLWENSSGVYICKSVENDLKHRNFTCKSEKNYLFYAQDSKSNVSVEIVSTLSTSGNADNAPENWRFYQNVSAYEGEHNHGKQRKSLVHSLNRWLYSLCTFSSKYWKSQSGQSLHIYFCLWICYGYYNFNNINYTRYNIPVGYH